jgi:large-conductance mechanosensitive channel
MTYQTIAVGVVLGLAIYNIAAGIVDTLINQYHSYRLNRILNDMDWSDYDEPVKKPRKKK